MLTRKIARVKIQQLLRRTGLLSFAEKIRYHLKKRILRKQNKAFISENPGFILPPADIAFDAYSAPDWVFYKVSGEYTARFLFDTVNKYIPGASLSIYEWGCGPGRIIRHLPAVFGPSVNIYGSDYNSKTIEWCKENIHGVNFSLNGLNPPLQYPAAMFDMVYCVSVFTHLSAATGLQWINELHRILKPGGILVMTTLGDTLYNYELLQEEKKRYQQEGIVVRDKYEEGKKMFLTWHNPNYVRRTLLKEFEVIEHLPDGFPKISQDCWIARR